MGKLMDIFFVTTFKSFGPSLVKTVVASYCQREILRIHLSARLTSIWRQFYTHSLKETEREREKYRKVERQRDSERVIYIALTYLFYNLNFQISVL